MTNGSQDDNHGERLSDAEIGKDAVQATIEAAATTVGRVARPPWVGWPRS